MPRLTKRYVIVCDEYRSGEYTYLEQAELGLASIEREGECTLPHHIEEF
ncbi:hypothetical protein [Ferrimicrobium sp.]|nr:hypothetical protein [Ferrimicrobium sp.]